MQAETVQKNHDVSVMKDVRERYAECRDQIRQSLFRGADPGEVVSVTGTGDRHLHGDSVSKIVTSGGYTLYYKPRDCRSAVLLGDLSCLLFGEQMVPDQLIRKGYAFQKAVVHQMPETELQRAGYYQKLGWLTALFYALGSTDMHNGNILCADGTPMVIDTETLLCAKADGVGGAGEFSVDYGEIFPDYLTSVGESMILPRFYGYRQTSPLVPEAGCISDVYEQAFIAGFREGYRKIIEYREEIKQILDHYADVPFRYVLRSTQYYAVRIQLYQNTKAPERQENILKGLEKGLSESDLRRWAPVLAWERSCIREGDVPYFWFCADGRDLMGDVDAEALIPGFLDRSPIRYAGWRMERMCEKDLGVQTAYIRASLKHFDGWEQPGSAMKSSICRDSVNEILSVQDAVREAEETLLNLWDERIPLSDGCCLWHTPLVHGKVGCLFGLAEGFSGIAVFAHACAVSPLIAGEASNIAGKLSAACFRTLSTFGEYLLRTYPVPAEERLISRRFNGDYGFEDGLSGFLWAINQCRKENPGEADRILNGFRNWNTDPEGGYDQTALQYLAGKLPNDGASCETDCLENGEAGKAAGYLADAGEGTEADRMITDAGIIVNHIVQRKRKAGNYCVYRKGRHSYFLPAFLRGNTGIAYVLLCYAEIIQRSKGHNV